MNKPNKQERIATIVKILTENPKKILTLNYFADFFSCAKSTLSEDVDAIQRIFQRFQLGKVETMAGAAGGIFYRPLIPDEHKEKFCTELCKKLNAEDRLIPGGYIYMNDIVYDPQITSIIGKILAEPYQYEEVDYVVTIETKGIPIAFMTARMLNKPMVVVRKSAKLTEGTTIQMNYISGSSKRIETMSLAKRAIPKGSKILFIDDFMKAGSTAKGIIDLMAEFEAFVVGVGVVMATVEPENKLVRSYESIFSIESHKSNKIFIRPSIQE